MGVPVWGVPAWGEVPGQGVYLPGGRGGVPAWGCTYLGVCTCLGGTCPGTPPCGQTDTCENITFAISFAGGKN